MKSKLLILIVVFAIALSTSFVAKASINNMSLDGYIIYIDAGHGGKDNGASTNNVLEDEINLSISKLLVENLINKGAYVYTTRDGDYDLASNYDKNRKAKDLKKRVELINKIKPDLFVSIHLNTFNNDSVNGGQIFFQNNENSKLLATLLQDEFNDLSNKDKKAKLGDYYLLNKTDSIGVIIECGFLTNKNDSNNLVKSDYQAKIAKIIANAIFNYFKKRI